MNHTVLACLKCMSISTDMQSVDTKNRTMYCSDEGPTLETLDFAFYVGSTPTFLYFDFAKCMSIFISQISAERNTEEIFQEVRTILDSLPLRPSTSLQHFDVIFISGKLCVQCYSG